MRSHPLIRHPVGKMPAAARWYLAGISILTLLLIAIHFAIQVYAQQEARRLVSAWSESAGLTVEGVRYRMLRGALTLVDLRLNRDAFQIYASNLFLHGNLSSLASDEPSVTRIEMRGLHASMKAKALAAFSEGRELPEVFKQLWASAQQVGIYDAKVDFLPETGTMIPSRPVSLKIVRLQGKQASGKRSIEALAYGMGGEIRLMASEDLTVLPDRFSGNVAWTGMDAEPFLESLLGLTPMQGQLSGNMTWVPKPEGMDHYTLGGEAGLGGLEEGSLSSSKIRWNGVFEDGKWHGKINGTAWPLTMFADTAPQFQERKLISGSFTGAVNFSGNLEQWQMGVVETYLDHVHYGQAVVENSDSPEWKIEKVHITKAALQWPQRRIDIKDAELINADLGFDVRERESSKLTWSIKTGEIGLNRVRSALHLPQGTFRLPVMKGSFAVKENRRIKLLLKSVASDDKGGEERWRISGEGDWTANNHSRMKMEVAAENAALVRFRALMPAKIRKTATDLTGSVKIKWKLLAGAGPWEGSGEASVAGAGFIYNGEQWQADNLLVDIEKMGVEIPEQLIRQLNVQGWRYQAALQPLGRMGASPEVAMTETGEAERWHLKSIILQDGKVSVGHEEAVWMDQTTANIKNLKPGSSAPITLKGRLGEGLLFLKGELSWNSALPEVSSAKISIRDALPFFMNEWLEVSGAPELIRGRIYTDASLKLNPEGYYKGMWYLRVQNGALGSAAKQSDPLLKRTGFNAFDVFSALQHERRIRLRIPVNEQGSFGEVLGSAFVKQLNSEMAKKGGAAHELNEKTGLLLSSVRLHEKGVLSQNERVRLRKVILYLRENPKQSIELIPQLGISSTEVRQVERSRYTQHLIEKFMSHRGIPLSRIFPVWPGEEHRSSESAGGILIHALQ